VSPIVGNPLMQFCTLMLVGPNREGDNGRYRKQNRPRVVIQKAQTAQNPERVRDQQQARHLGKGHAAIGQSFEEVKENGENGRSHQKQHTPPTYCSKNIR
jgi:hypothetical protein